MKNYQSKFSNKKSGSGRGTMGSKSSSGCCCGSKPSEDIDEIDVMEIEEDK